MFARLLSGLLFPTLVVLAQAPTAPAPQPAMAAETGLHPTADGTWVGLGPDYKVHFGAEHAVFTPVLGAGAPHDLPLQWAVTQVGRGALRSVGPTTRREGDRHVDYVRPEFVERLEVRGDGLKQSFHFDTLPEGDGDLVVRVAVATELQAPLGATGDDLSFTRPGCGGVHIGQVVGFDAEGRSTTGSLRWNGTELDFVLPAAFVAAARLPLVVDPLLATLTGVTSGAIEDRAPVVAYHNSSTDVYLVVWRRTISATNHDVMAQRVASAGNLVGGLLALESTASDAGAPQVAEAGPLFWVAVWEQNGDIRGMRVTPTGVLSPLSITSTPDQETAPDLGGSPDFPFLKVVWRNASANSIEGAHVTLAPTLSVVPIGAIVSGTVTTVVSEPALSQSNPTATLLLTHTSASTLLGTTSVRGQFLALNGGLVGSSFAVAGGTSTADARRAASAGDGSIYLVAYETDGLLGPGLACRSVQQRLGVVELGSPRSLAPLGVAAGHPAVAWFDGSAVIAWTRPNGSAHDVLVTSVDPLTGANCEGQQDVELGGNDSVVALCSQFGHQASSNQGRGAIAYTDLAGVARVRLRHYEAVDGVQEPLGGGCGGFGRTYGTSARVGNAGFGFQLVSAPPAVASFVLLSFAPIPGGFACGPCVAHPDYTNGVTAFTGTTSAVGGARYGLAIPAQASLAGLQLVAQFAGFGTECMASIKLNSALRVVIQ